MNKQFLKRKVEEYNKEIMENDPRIMGTILAHTKEFREVLSYALEERYGRPSANMLMTLVDAGEDKHKRF